MFYFIWGFKFQLKGSSTVNTFVLDYIFMYIEGPQCHHQVKISLDPQFGYYKES